MQIRFVPWGARVVAFLIDIALPVVLIGIGAILGAPHYETVTREAPGFTYQVQIESGFGAMYYVCWIIALAFYFWNKGYREGKTGQSIGKKLTHSVTLGDLNGQPIGVGMGIVRALLLWVDFAICYIGVLWPLWDEKRQCLVSDKATKAIVVRDDPGLPPRGVSGRASGQASNDFISE